MLNAAKRFWTDQSGTTAIEYGMIGTLIAVACYGAFQAVGLSISDMFNRGVAAKVQAAIGP